MKQFVNSFWMQSGNVQKRCFSTGLPVFIALIAAAVLITAACRHDATTTTFTVKFKTNGGSAVIDQTVAEGGKVGVVTCTKSGHTFAGWFTASTFAADSKWDFDNDLVTGDMTLYAKWVANTGVTYTVTFNVNGGSAVATKSITGGGKVPTVTCTKSGYVLEGWYTTSNFITGSKWNFSSSTVTGNITLYAKWVTNTGATYTVTFNVNGGSAIAAKNVTQGNKVGAVTCTRSGYTLAGWYTTSNFTTGSEWDLANDLVTGNITLYAKWVTNTGVTYTVTFNVNGGSAIAAKNVTQGNKVGTVICAKDGYMLTGWYTTSNFTAGSEWDLANDLVTGNITLYAKWKQNGSPLTTIAEITTVLTVAASEPITLAVAIDLGDMGSGSALEELFKVLKTADKEVSLDLSACDMGSTAFNPRLITDVDAIAGKGKIVNIVLPDAVTSISNGNYYDATFKEFTSLESFSAANLTTIGDHAFYDCTSLALTSLPAGVSSIGYGAFWGCTNLALTSLPVGVDSIDQFAFYECSSLALTSLPVGLTSIGLNAFYNCTNLALTSLPAELTFIDDGAFASCSSLALTSLPVGVTSIGGGTFHGCTSLALTSLPVGVTSIGIAAFYDCTSLALTSLPVGLTSIDDHVFDGCSSLALTSLPAGMTSIGIVAFRGCTSLTSLELPVGITSIGNSAFYDCSSLVMVTCHATTPPTLGTHVFANTHASLKIYVPAGSVSAYTTAWSNYASKIEPITP